MASQNEKAKDESAKESGGSQVIARAALILRTLEPHADGLALGELARQTGLPKTTVHRLLAALESEQFVRHTRTGWRLGAGLARLAASAHTDVVALARPFMESLGRRTRETVDLCVERGVHAVLLDHYPSDQELRVVSPIGTAFPLHSTAQGKALLAQLSTQELASRLQELNLEGYTESTLTQMAALEHSVLRVQAQEGMGVDEQENSEGVCALGVVLKVATAERYTLSIAVPAHRFARQRSLLVDALLRCKAEIEALVLKPE
ncbi:IclR family transcriptional regulator [Pokkaliibacter sp. CJK22405]|uniref:IclR family transcriptional regulator n=1 Tax=Pokkaliibacter sp. CJK22405 TaxID=3384615 RepID=UPI0039852D09